MARKTPTSPDRDTGVGAKRGRKAGTRLLTPSVAPPGLAASRESVASNLAWAVDQVVKGGVSIGVSREVIAGARAMGALLRDQSHEDKLRQMLEVEERVTKKLQQLKTGVAILRRRGINVGELMKEARAELTKEGVN